MNTDILHRRRREGRAIHKRGQEDQALGRSRGGFGTKIHLKTDRYGLPLGFELTGGEASDCQQFADLMETGPEIRHSAIFTYKGYDSNATREASRKAGAVPFIPYKSNRCNIPKHFAKALYRRRAGIEQMM